jgi:protein-L-isoaspartate(D-aspartate) O-methyltransferase
MRSEAEATAEFLLRLRAQGIRDLALLRALETVPRRSFAPHRYADLAGRDVALPIACGQTMSEPSLLARMIEGLEPEPDHRLLEVGTGTGYCTAIVARLCAEIVSIERFRTLVLEAKTRFSALAIDRVPVDRVTIIWADALVASPSLGMFHRILVHGTFAEPPQALVDRLETGGIMIFARAPAAVAAGTQRDNQRLVQARREADGSLSEKDIGAARLSALLTGLSREL